MNQCWYEEIKDFNKASLILGKFICIMILFETKNIDNFLKLPNCNQKIEAMTNIKMPFMKIKRRK